MSDRPAQHGTPSGKSGRFPGDSSSLNDTVSSDKSFRRSSSASLSEVDRRRLIKSGGPHFLSASLVRQQVATSQQVQRKCTAEVQLPQEKTPQLPRPRSLGALRPCPARGCNHAVPLFVANSGPRVEEFGPWVEELGFKRFRGSGNPTSHPERLWSLCCCFGLACFLLCARCISYHHCSLLLNLNDLNYLDVCAFGEFADTDMRWSGLLSSS